MQEERYICKTSQIVDDCGKESRKFFSLEYDEEPVSGWRLESWPQRTMIETSMVDFHAWIREEDLEYIVPPTIWNRGGFFGKWCWERGCAAKVPTRITDFQILKPLELVEYYVLQCLCISTCYCIRFPTIGKAHCLLSFVRNSVQF